ncbi:hypothetical protein EV188_111108 [Actinomycetospora succinea]|uniref:Uncharacterized protein n=2 Tax=Actinomycetospora succinea TaxID=663603 RepID=A0A4R6UP28_9PSEU|nr:hypothetical protein EV188_111108 [Actinomycetospora succinea]
MGQHSARRSGGAMTSVAGRGLFTATAAVALLGGGTSMAFAGEAPSSGGHDGESASSSHHESENCSIPVVDDTTKTGEATVNGLTGDASAPLFEAGGEATQPVHDAVCPPASELLGGVLGDSGDEGQESSDDSSDAQEATSQQASSEEESDDSGQQQVSSAASSEGSSGGSGTGVPMELPIQ